MEAHGTNLRICSREQHVTIQAEFGRATVGLPMNVAHNIQGDKTRFRERVLKMALEEFSTPTLSLMEQQLKSFFKELFGVKIRLPFYLGSPIKIEPNSALMFMPDHLTEDAILTAYRKKWHLYCVNENHQPIASWIDQDLEQVRPFSRIDGGYYFEFHLSNKPDVGGMGLVFSDLFKEPFGQASLAQMMNLKEYLLASGFMKFHYGNFMDQNGTETITSSRTSETSYVYGKCSNDGGAVYIYKDHVSTRNNNRGSRDIVLGSTYSV